MATALYLAIGEYLLDAYPQFVAGDEIELLFEIERHTLYSCVSELRKAGYEIENIPCTHPEGGVTGWRLTGTRETPLIRAELHASPGSLGRMAPPVAVEPEGADECVGCGGRFNATPADKLPVCPACK